MIPKQSEIELPLLRALVKLGGQAEANKVYPLVIDSFPDLTEEDLAERLPTGANRMINRIQWVRQRLVSKGFICSPAYGIWAITEKGRKRVAEADGQSEEPSPQPPDQPGLVQLYEEYEEAFKQKLLQSLLDLTPAEFERFAKGLLRVYGFADVKVTGRSGDGGIDGHGKLRVGLATMDVAFQCKRWQGNVGPSEINVFRGAITGEFEQGVFFTTSDFTKAARNLSIKKGAVPIILLNGKSIVDLMIEKEYGVRRRPLELYIEDMRAILEEGDNT